MCVAALLYIDADECRELRNAHATGDLTPDDISRMRAALDEFRPDLGGAAALDALFLHGNGSKEH